MTTWTTLETIAESAQRSEFAVRSFYVDRLGVHQYHEDDRVRFDVATADGSKWSIVDREAEDDQTGSCHGTMRDCVKWLAARVLYGA